MKIVFFGTPDYVLPILTSLHKKFVSGPGVSPIAAVVTQSPKPTGRKQILTYSPVDKWAHEHKIDIFYQSSELIKNSVKADIGVLAAYGEIIPKIVIDTFPHGILVVHPSLLPKYRGASPIQGAIANGDKQVGVTIIKMDEKMDHGPIVSQFKEETKPDDTTDTLRARLFERSKDVIVEMIEPYLQGKIKPKEQNHDEATYTKIITKQDGFIEAESFTSEAAKAERFIRAMQPWPQAWTLIGKKRLKILKAHLESGKLILDEVQLEGKSPVSWEEFKRGYPDANL
ncbi:methionyl-tRNA formyltransferase [Candidatus Woesebacteria bacterium RIFOXYC1_FULL_46_16]|nr:MAG: Methionyl-tRNA formyltransferase [Candidatus Woesebacteria bacterium GW2011_GWF1_46_13]KKU48821.1 MAG: Methionyl-tRNA formyltransferase [Candidatus Woesebacteria bacterium GW2011_GWF2_46_8]OGM84778.1 MAG: methionyl-tRNA formyltransferase [Candidatus Woesebacteria bacterium RIFOXYC1_FULL_46_16]